MMGKADCAWLTSRNVRGRPRTSAGHSKAGGNLPAACALARREPQGPLPHLRNWAGGAGNCSSAMCREGRVCELAVVKRQPHTQGLGGSGGG